MLQRTIPEPWRQRLLYAGMSLLVTWHTLAMVVATAPDSLISENARRIFDPYLTLFRLDNQWGFFAPNVGNGSQFRYVVEDASGKMHTFVPADSLNKFHPTSIWVRDRYRLVMEEPETYGDAAGAGLCREHAALNPVSITLFEADQKDFWPEDRQKGKAPLDAEYVELNLLKQVRCTEK
jgi:hypothetical protein